MIDDAGKDDVNVINSVFKNIFWIVYCACDSFIQRRVVMYLGDRLVVFFKSA